ncbi:unnamed protein product [Nippostrongylus brasiliensis]|uniref:Homeobox domain-containing protein n=1 Tax=Nippostrongylus brasiliensis TaxID=27835 RepID=A0A0N4XND6_NIPBR|nr:unnamed protein product [Nippostrongylus brasiliensis]
MRDGGEVPLGESAKLGGQVLLCMMITSHLLGVGRQLLGRGGGSEHAVWTETGREEGNPRLGQHFPARALCSRERKFLEEKFFRRKDTLKAKIKSILST